MKTDRRKDTLSLLFEAFEKPCSFYVLGAGASAGIVPTTPELKQGILERYHSFGLFLAEPCLPDDVFYRVIGDPDKPSTSFTTSRIDDELIARCLVKRLPPSAVHAMVIKYLTPIPEKIIENAHAYEIFLFIKKPSTIFCMNVDGLTRRYCNGHNVLELHGSVPANFTLHPVWDEIINDSLEFRIRPPQIPGLILPQPEPSNITSLPKYDEAVYRLRTAEFVVFIGYSFAFFDKTQSFDDLETFEFFRYELRKYYRKKVLILDPNPEFIGNAIEEAARVKVQQLPFYWNHLCQAIKEEIFSHGCRQFQEMKSLINKIIYRHDQLREEKG